MWLLKSLLKHTQRGGKKHFHIEILVWPYQYPKTFKILSVTCSQTHTHTVLIPYTQQPLWLILWSLVSNRSRGIKTALIT